MTLQQLAGSPWFHLVELAPLLMVSFVLAVMVVWVSRLQFRLAESEERIRNQAKVIRGLWEAAPRRRSTPARDSELMVTRFESQPWWGGLNG